MAEKKINLRLDGQLPTRIAIAATCATTPPTIAVTWDNISRCTTWTRNIAALGAPIRPRGSGVSISTWQRTTGMATCLILNHWPSSRQPWRRRRSRPKRRRKSQREKGKWKRKIIVWKIKIISGIFHHPGTTVLTIITWKRRKTLPRERRWHWDGKKLPGTHFATWCSRRSSCRRPPSHPIVRKRPKGPRRWWRSLRAQSSEGRLKFASLKKRKRSSTNRSKRWRIYNVFLKFDDPHFLK